MLISSFLSSANTVRIDSKHCGSFACFFDSNNIASLIKSLTKLMPEVARATIVYDSIKTVKTVKLSTPKPFLLALTKELSRVNVGVRVEALDAYDRRTSSIEALDVLKTVKTTFKTKIDMTKHTTYAPLRLEGKGVLMVILYLPSMKKYSYSDNTILTNTIILGFQQPCQYSIVDMVSSNKLKPKYFKTFMLQIKDSLNIMHNHPKSQQFHGDLKWDNMVYCKDDNRAKLIDFPTHSQTKPFNIDDHRYSFTHSWKFTTNHNKIFSVLFGRDQSAESKPSQIVTGASYDQMCFNMLIATYCVMMKQSVSLYNACHYPEATNYMIATKISVDDEGYYDSGLRFIRKNKHQIKP